MIQPGNCIQNFLKHPSNTQLDEVIKSCNIIINYSIDSDKEIIKIIGKVYEAICTGLDETDHQHKTFANFYIRLSKMVSKNKHQIKCLQSASVIFKKIISLNLEDTEAHIAYEDVSIQLNIRDNYKRTNLIIDEFDRKFLTIEKGLSELYSGRELKRCFCCCERNESDVAICNKVKEEQGEADDPLQSEKIRNVSPHGEYTIILNADTINPVMEEFPLKAIQNDILPINAIERNGIYISNETINYLSLIKESIKNKKLSKSEEQKTLILVEKINSTAQEIQNYIIKLNSSQDMLTLSGTLKRIIKFTKNISLLIKQKKEFLFEQKPCLDLAKAEEKSSADGISESNASFTQLVNTDDRTAELPLSITSLLPPLKESNIETLEILLNDFIIIRDSISHAVRIILNLELKEKSPFLTEFYLISNFFNFTEINYFELYETRKKIIQEMIRRAETIFNPHSNLLRDHPFILASYISILVQKHHYLQSNKKYDNLKKIELNIINYKLIHKEQIGNIKILSAILNLNNPKKSKILSPRRHQQLESNPEREKTKKIFLKVIRIFEEDKINKKIDLISLKEIMENNKKNNIDLTLLKNIIDLFTNMCEFNTEHHNLNQIDLFKISFKVEEGFFYNSFKGHQFKDLVLLKKDEFFDRSILIDIKTKSFTILSRLHGDLKQQKQLEGNEIKYTYIKGGIKKISAALYVFRQEENILFQETILAEPRKNQCLEKKSIDYMFQFCDKRGLMGCHYYMEYPRNFISDNDLQLKQLIIQDRADGDLSHFLNLKLEAHELKTIDTWKSLFLILGDVIHGLNYLHSINLIHWDLKLANILYFREDLNSPYQGKICDFDTTFNAGNGDQPPLFCPGYGAIVYQAPESAEKGRFEQITMEQTKRCDMFATGCTFIDILNFGLEIVKYGTVYEKVSHNEISRIDLFRSLIDSSNIKNLDSYEGFLKYAAYNLIDPNPLERWNSETLKIRYAAFEEKQWNVSLGI